MDTATDVKTCPRCVEAKPLTDFNRNASAADGRQTYCRVCTTARKVCPRCATSHGIPGRIKYCGDCRGVWRTCATCKQVKRIIEFNRNSARSTNYCRPCSRDRGRRISGSKPRTCEMCGVEFWSPNHRLCDGCKIGNAWCTPGQHVAPRALMYSTRKGISGTCKACAADKDSAAGMSLTVHEIRALRSRGCDICGAERSPDGRSLSIDHDHKCCSGIKSCGSCIRGVLCSWCNLGIGKLRDSAEILQSAADYLANPPGRRMNADAHQG